MLTDFRTEIRDLIEVEWPARFDWLDAEHPGTPGKLPRLVGYDGEYAGVYPNQQNPRGIDLESTVIVQFYLAYNKTKPIDPKWVADPAVIEETVNRFQEIVKDAIGGGTGARWFYNITAIDYPPDPVGQITRADITLAVRGTNPAILETTG